MGQSSMLKAFVLCEQVADDPTNSDRKDLRGAGLSHLAASEPLPIKASFWVFAQLSDQKEIGELRLAILRADSGRRYFFRAVEVQHRDPLRATVVCVRLYDCAFPERGIYFVEPWYDDVWIVDQRLEVS